MSLCVSCEARHTTTQRPAMQASVFLSQPPAGTMDRTTTCICTHSPPKTGHLEREPRLGLSTHQYRPVEQGR